MICNVCGTRTALLGDTKEGLEEEHKEIVSLNYHLVLKSCKIPRSVSFLISISIIEVPNC